VVEVARGEVTSQTCQYIFECLGGTNKGCSEGFTELLHRYRMFVQAYLYKNITLCALEVEIINVHVFTHQPGLIHQVLHI
jgi:hypothetical protein